MHISVNRNSHAFIMTVILDHLRTSELSYVTLSELHCMSLVNKPAVAIGTSPFIFTEQHVLHTSGVVLHADFRSLTGTATVTVVVVDVNDNAPQFNHANYAARVTENRRPGEVVARVRASDRDAGRNADVRSVELSGRYTLNDLVYQKLIPEICTSVLHQKFDVSSCKFLVQICSGMVRWYQIL